MAAIDNDAKTAPARDDSIDQGDVLKGDITVGAIGGRDVQRATEHEHNLSFREAVRLYPKAVAWSMFFSLGIIMTAYVWRQAKKLCLAQRRLSASLYHAAGWLNILQVRSPITRSTL